MAVERVAEPAASTQELTRSIWEGAAFALMLGLGEVFFVAAAVRLQASSIQLGLVVGLPLASGGLGSILALALLAQRWPRRRVVLLAGLLQVTALACLSTLAWRQQLAPQSLILLACLYHGAAMAASTSWNSWFGDLVPPELRGRFFARRSRAVQISTCLGLIAGGVGLQLADRLVGTPGGGADHLYGFAVLFAAAAAARLVSLAMLATAREPRFSGLSSAARLWQFRRTERGHIALRILLVGCGIQLVTYLSSPFFAPFMLRELEFSYIEYTLATLIVVVAKIAVLPRWGGMLDDVGPRRMYALAAVLVALVPLPWLWAGGLGWVLVAQAFSGIAWASYEVSFLTLLIESSVRRTRPQVFAAQNLLNGSAQFVGGLVGGVALAAFGGRFQLVFALSLVLRLTIALLIPWLVPRLGVPRRTRRDLALRLVGLRPHGGAVFRVVDEPGEGTD